MRSRILIGSGAWVVGVLAATGGSLYVSQQLGQGFFASNPALTSSQVTTGLQGSGEPAESTSPAAGTSTSTSPSSSPSGSHSGSPSSSGSHTPSGSKSSSSPAPAPGSGSGPSSSSSPAPAPSSTPAGQLFTSDQGSVYADCKPGGAYLEYWIAQDGYDAVNVVRGPAAIASVTFKMIGGNRGIIMNVNCSQGVPQPQTRTFGGE